LNTVVIIFKIITRRFFKVVDTVPAILRIGEGAQDGTSPYETFLQLLPLVDGTERKELQQPWRKQMLVFF